MIKRINFDVDKGVSQLAALSNIFKRLCVFREVSTVDKGTILVIATDCVQ